MTKYEEGSGAQAAAAQRCSEPDGNNPVELDGDGATAPAHLVMLALTGECPWCGQDDNGELLPPEGWQPGDAIPLDVM